MEEDANSDGNWSPAAGATVYANQSYTTGANGTVAITINSAQTVSVYAEEAGYIRSNKVTVYVGSSVGFFYGNYPPTTSTSTVVYPVQGLSQTQLDTVNTMIAQGKSGLEVSNYLDSQGIPAGSMAFMSVIVTIPENISPNLVSDSVRQSGYTIQMPDGTRLIGTIPENICTNPNLVSDLVRQGGYTIQKPDGTVDIYTPQTGLQNYTLQGGQYVLTTTATTTP